MKQYKEFTIAWIILLFMVLAGAIVGYLYYFNESTDSSDKTGLIIFVVATMLVLLNFYGLKVVVGEEIVVSFGVGLIRRRIALSDIKSVESVTNPWYYGWGVRIIPNGWMFNITGNKAVEVSFKNSSRVFRIGTKDPSKLTTLIQSKVS